MTYKGHITNLKRFKKVLDSYLDSGILTSVRIDNKLFTIEGFYISKDYTELFQAIKKAYKNNTEVEYQII